MSTTAADVHPSLPRIKTAPPAVPDPAPACSSAASSSTAPAPDAESVATATLPSSAAENQQQQQPGVEADSEAQQEQETEPRTPTSEESQLRPPAECPPAPRKPVWAPATKRKFQSSAAPSARRTFFPVARDLTTVFRALPPKKRIRAG